MTMPLTIASPRPVLSRDGHVGLIEALEDIGGLILRNADPVVLHSNPHLVAIPAHVNVNDWGNTFAEITSGIAEKIDEDLSDTFGIEFETLSLRIDGTRHLELKSCRDKLCRLVDRCCMCPSRNLVRSSQSSTSLRSLKLSSCMSARI